MSAFDRFMAVPYREGGRDMAGADCFGLYLLILRYAARLEIERHPGLSAMRQPKRAMAAIEAAIAAGAWRKVWTPGDSVHPGAVAQRFDAVLLRAHVRRRDGAVVAAPLHIGCATGVGQVIHTESGIGPRCDAFDDPMLKPRLRGVFRPQGLAA